MRGAFQFSSEALGPRKKPRYLPDGLIRACENIGVFKHTQDRILAARSKEKDSPTGTITVLALLASKFAALLAHSKTKLYLLRMLSFFHGGPYIVGARSSNTKHGGVHELSHRIKKGVETEHEDQP